MFEAHFQAFEDRSERAVVMWASVILVSGVAMVMFGVIFFRLWYLQVLSSEQYVAQADANRARELPIAAPRGAILYQFLMEAVIISGTGALTGIAIAVAIPFFAEALLRFFPIPTEIHIPVSWVSVVIAFVVSCSTGLLFGYLPASKAAQLHPTESLRYE